ncbi:NAD(P)-binding protein, partial [Streptomyces caniscabiei]
MSSEPGAPRLTIVGAGPAGLAAALAAAGRGVRVTLVDA